MDIITKRISDAIPVLQKGKVVAFPTGTSYGLAADALQSQALERLRALKQRPQEKTFTVFLQEKLWDVFFNLTKEERELLKQYPHSPLTLLVEPQEQLRHLELDGRVGLRVIDHPLMDQLARAVDVPLTATSANVSGQEACADVGCIQKQLASPDLEYIIDGGTLAAGAASTIARFNNGAIEIIRQGALRLFHTT